ncbi:MAG: hypothetical protein ACOC0N_04115 [Chroococcales cyanobacterium]
MNRQELEQKALQLPLRDRWILVQSLLNSLEKETLNLAGSKTVEESLAELDPWTKSLIGIVNLDSLDPIDSYVDYLEEKYR